MLWLHPDGFLLAPHRPHPAILTLSMYKGKHNNFHLPFNTLSFTLDNSHVIYCSHLVIIFYNLIFILHNTNLALPFIFYI